MHASRKRNIVADLQRRLTNEMQEKRHIISGFNLLKVGMDTANRQLSLKTYELTQAMHDLDMLQQQNEDMVVSLQRIRMEKQAADTYINAELQNIVNAYISTIQSNLNERLWLSNELNRARDFQAREPESGLNVCCVCMSCKKDACLSCGHQLCQSCASKVTLCPICRMQPMKMPGGKDFLKLYN